MVLRTARFLLRNAADADDLAQETMLKAFRSLDRLKPGTNAKAWLLTILRNARIDHLRSRASADRAVSLEQMACEPEAPEQPPGRFDADEAWDDPERVLQAFGDQQIIDAMKQLPEEIRLTLLLVDVHGMEITQAAAVLDVPAGTIKSRTHRGRAMLRDVLLPLALEMRLERRGTSDSEVGQ
jgi:RNA polymerase sigma-70 factor (ECF subfamily)